MDADPIDDGKLPAFAPAMVAVPTVGPLGQQGIRIQAMNGNVSLADYFMQGLAQACVAGFDSNLTDAYLDLTTRECWRVADSIVRTRAERLGQGAAPEPKLIGGAA